jgi:hypothetical protein
MQKPTPGDGFANLDVDRHPLVAALDGPQAMPSAEYISII